MGGPGSDSPNSPPFDRDRFHASLRTHAFGRALHYSASTASTNADALAYLQQPATTSSPHGLVILADCQTAGRGRRGRTWHSPPQGNLYFSLIVVPQPGATRILPWLTWVPLLSALAAADCLSHQTGIPVSVKWPNDLLIHDKKVGGILCEQTTTADRTMAIIIGIGLNINAPPSTFPEDLQPGATTLAAEAGQTCDRVAILADLLLRLEQRLDRLFHDGPAGMIEEFTQRCSTIGKIIRVTLEEQGMVQGIAESIGPDGCLRLRVASNESPAPPSTLLEVRSAEVVHLRG
ncbi:MAG: Biotin--[acetyl-CoA-carboxylase] ligase [Nitrospira sp.]|nr:MAG: Biotin--[acetyl-CoA-carboxylase] ligase [Nitrospira sp.]